MQKKVLFVITKAVWGGAQRYVYDLATHLPPDKFNVSVAVGGEGTLIEKLKSQNIKVVPLPNMQRNNKFLDVLFAPANIVVLWRMIQLLREEKPEIIHLNSSKIGGIGIISAFVAKMTTFNFRTFKTNYNPKTIFTVHGWAFNEDRNSIVSTFIYSFQWITAMLTHRMVIISNHDFRQAVQMPFLKKEKFVLIRNGVPSTALSYLPKREARSALKKIDNSIQTGNTLLIGTVAELTKNKGLNYLVDSINLIKKQLPNEKLQCIVIGAGSEKIKLQTHITELGLENKVIVAGFISNAAHYLKAFDIFTLPSLKEGLPYTILESMHAGLPVVATPVGGVSDLVEKESNGLLVSSKNAEALCTAFKKLITDKTLRQAYSKESLKKSKAKFSFETMLKRTIALYEE
jgi:glycosyltransferase involved in cell wall biosynthesis